MEDAAVEAKPAAPATKKSPKPKAKKPARAKTKVKAATKTKPAPKGAPKKKPALAAKGRKGKAPAKATRAPARRAKAPARKAKTARAAAPKPRKLRQAAPVVPIIKKVIKSADAVALEMMVKGMKHQTLDAEKVFEHQLRILDAEGQARARELAGRTGLNAAAAATLAVRVVELEQKLRPAAKGKRSRSGRELEPLSKATNHGEDQDAGPVALDGATPDDLPAAASA